MKRRLLLALLAAPTLLSATPEPESADCAKLRHAARQVIKNGLPIDYANQLSSAVNQPCAEMVGAIESLLNSATLENYLTRAYTAPDNPPIASAPPLQP